MTKANRADFEALFLAPGGPKYCWCMVWRATPEELKNTKSAARHVQMRDRLDNSVPVGLLAYRNQTPIAWVSIAPKSTFLRLGGPAPAPNENIWSLVCMFLPKDQRGQGLAHELIKGAVAYARNQGATHVEAYPVKPESPSYRFMGFVPAFEQAGFEPLGMAGSRRHVMRLTLRPQIRP